MSKCVACKEGFRENDQVVIVDETYYHKDCVTLYPTGYVAFVDGEHIGETDNEDGEPAYDIAGLGLLDEDDNE